MREMRRVLKPEGVAGVYDPDYATLLQEPSTPRLQELSRLIRRFSEENGSPYYARHQRQYFLEAGFARTEGFVFAVGGEPGSHAVYVPSCAETNARESPPLGHRAWPG